MFNSNQSYKNLKSNSSQSYKKIKFDYRQSYKTLKVLKYKIYVKQKLLLQYMYDNNINFENETIKQYIDEINLLEEIYDIKKYYFDYYSKNDTFNHLFY